MIPIGLIPQQAGVRTGSRICLPAMDEQGSVARGSMKTSTLFNQDAPITAGERVPAEAPSVN
jgi:hypothetical protein